VAKYRRGDNQKKKKRGGAGASHIYTHNFVVRNLITRGLLVLTDIFTRFTRYIIIKKVYKNKYLYTNVDK